MAEHSNFDQLRLGLASPEEIRKWSNGEVKKPETINYRTFKPEPDGLFCERIFGPTRDWECHCGKYRKIKFRGITCDRCGVEVTRARVRRERMGHIDLAAPVSHIWYLKGVPSPMALLLDISPHPLERVIYFASYIVTQVDYSLLTEGVEQIKAAAEDDKLEIDQVLSETIEMLQARHQEQTANPEEPLSEADRTALQRSFEERIKSETKAAEERKADLDNTVRLLLGSKLDAQPGITKKQLISEAEYRNLKRLTERLADQYDHRYRGLVQAGLGADAIRELLREIDLEELARALRKEVAETSGPKRARAVKRLEVVEAFRKSKNRPEWMILEAIPVIPPELRPMVQLDGGRFATSDLNDLYRRIINRNNRLKKIKELHAPESIISHEKRLLQEAVDALIDNGRRTRPVTGSNNRPLKSLSDMLKGKEGRFRKNLLGKRVDYSGRSVIVVGPPLKLHQCGLPKEMALELFKPFVMKRLVELGHTSNVKTAKKMVDRVRPEVWDALEDVIRDHPVLLNRAPTLHRLGIQAFEPVLVDGKAIQIHPLVCVPFNADFDGDQMAVHVPLSTAAQAEARILMFSTQNLFSPADGKPVCTPTRDMVLGCYYLTQKRLGTPEKVANYPNMDQATLAYEMGVADLHEEARVRMDGQVVQTTIGRVIFNQSLPPKLRFLDRVVDQDELGRLVGECYAHYGTERTVQLLDDLKQLGFTYATKAGITISMTDMDVPQARREQIIARTEEQVRMINDAYAKGLITAGERSDEVCRLWNVASDEVSEAILSNIDPFNPIFMMANSKARGTRRQISQLAGMRGLMTDPFGRFIEDLPIKSNFHEGLNVLEYFVSTHGARKGLADTALRTADAGYLTRRLVDVAQDVIVRADDCQTTSGILISAIRDGAEEILSLERRIEGRIVPADLVDPRIGKIILRAGQEISQWTLPPCPRCGEELAEILRCRSCHHEFAPPTEQEPAPSEQEQFQQTVESVVEAISQQAPPEAAEEAEPGKDVQADDSAPAEAAAQPEPEPEPEPEVNPLLLGRCPDCAGDLETLLICGGCQSRFAPAELEPVLITIKRVVNECEQFLKAVKNVQAGQTVSQPLADPFTGETVVEAEAEITPERADRLRRLADELWSRGGLARGEVLVRSSLSCELRQGICARCYGRDFATNRLVEVGEAAGIIAAQSIGEPGTQLTMRTFHTGGVAAQYLTGVAEVKKKRQETLRELHEDIRRGLVAFEAEGEVGLERERVKKIQQMLKVLEEQVKGLLRVVELFEARRPKGQAIICELDGVVADIVTKGVKNVVVHSTLPLIPEEPVLGELTAGPVINPATGEVLMDAGKEITPQVMARLQHAGLEKVTISRSYLVPYRGYLKVEKGDRLQQGDSLTEGPLDPQKVLALKGVRGIQDYLVREIQSVYRSHGVDINDKHMEVIVRQMLKKRKLADPGDTEFLPGQVVDRFDFEQSNRQIREREGREATAEWQLLGITEASLATESFLSAASFQKTTRVLTEAAIKGKVDNLIGLKENVIIGRLIPAGTGMERYRQLKVTAPAERPYLTPEMREEDLRARMASLGEEGSLADQLGLVDAIPGSDELTAEDEESEAAI